MHVLDDVDDRSLVGAVSEQEPVKRMKKDLEAFEKTFLSCNDKEIEKLLGKPIPRAAKAYAMPVAQARRYFMSGIISSNSKFHNEFYSVEDFAGIEVRYGSDGETPVFVILYFKVDKAFPKLTEFERKPAEKQEKLPDPVTNIDERLKWDRERFDKLVKHVEKLRAAK